MIQQGMNEDSRQARRYHWLSTTMDHFTVEPQAAICCNEAAETLNLVSAANQVLAQTNCDMFSAPPRELIREIDRIDKHTRSMQMPERHSIPRTSYLNKSLMAAYEQQPQNFEQLLQINGVGPGTLRALCLVAEVAYGVEASFTDPVRYSFAHGGKDGYPFPVNEADIENSYKVLNKALHRCRAGHGDQLKALKNLARWHNDVISTNQYSCTPSVSRPSDFFVRSSAQTFQNKLEKEKGALVQASLFD